jgi:hypothetical protein
VNIITGGRRSGKTSELIRIASDYGGYIVCRNQMMCKEIKRMARKNGG